jgi:protein-disulfide isomerase
MTGVVLTMVFAATAGLAAEQALTEGHAGSPVQVVIYEDLQCPDCASFRRMMDDQLLPRYADKVEFRHRDFPLAKHHWARRAAIAARFFAMRRPELGLEYRRHTMANILDTDESNFEDRLANFAREHGVNPDEARAALRDARLDALVEKDLRDGIARGVAKTPTVFVNATPFIEHFSFEEISKGIDQALAEAK